LRGCFVTGTDTGVGKTVLAAAIVASLRERGVEASALKPVITGLDEPAASGWPADHELLAAVSGRAPEDVIVSGFGPAVSPHLAAELAGRPLGLAALRQATLAAAGATEVCVIEGVGGLLVPLDEAFLLRDLARELGLPIVIVARPGLGTINHTLLTIESARYAGLEVAGVVLTPWPERPDEIERSNHLTIARLGDVEVGTLGRVAAPEPRLLAEAAAQLPLDRWLR
jgi:dethiobiotin synthetase